MTKIAKYPKYVPVRMSDAQYLAMVLLAQRMGTDVSVSDAVRWNIERSPFYHEAVALRKAEEK